MGYCFMSIKKIKTASQLSGVYRHNYRKGEVINADPSKAHLNEELLNRDDALTFADEFRNRINQSDYYKHHKIRKDNVRALEIVTTFSKVDAEYVNIEQWKKDNVEWLKNTFDTPENDNVVSVMYHGDENGNVHCHAVVIPIDEEGKLNAKKWTGGAKVMTVHQNSYYQYVGKRHNLKRGLLNSKARHEDIKKFYTELNQALDVKAPSPEKDEDIGHYFQRINKVVEDLSIKNLQDKKMYERKIVEAKTVNLGDFEELERLKKENKRLKDFQNYIMKEGMDKLVLKAQVADDLQYGLQHHEDRELAEQTATNIKILTDYGKAQRLQIKGNSGKER